jgi:hypothetical protein
MTNPAPPSSGENLPLDDDDVILLTDEIPPAENHDMIEICQLADRPEPQEVLKPSQTAKEKPAFIDLTDVFEPSDFKTELPLDFSESDAEINGPSAAIDDGEFFLQEIAPSSLDNDFSGSRELTASSTPFFSFDVSKPPITEYPADDLQRLIDEVVHDSQVPPQDFSGMPPEISKSGDIPVVKDELASLPQDQIDAAMERVIRNIFAEKIEFRLDELITTTFNKEIEKLKTILLDYLSSGKAAYKVKP